MLASEPEIFNTDQGVQFTSLAFTSCLESRGVAISMDGRGRALDNVFVERLWRTVKYEEVYLKDYENAWQAETSLREYFEFYCYDRRHQELGQSHAGRSVRSAAKEAEHQACDEQSALNIGVRNVGLRR